MTLEEFFLCSVDDLKSRVANPTPYNLIRSSGIVRKLLIDNRSMAPDLSKKLGLKLQFRPCTDLVDLPGLNWQVAINLHVKRVPQDLPAVTLNQFLQTICMIINGRQFSIKEIIRLVAHVYGGVHFGKPECDHQQIMAMDLTCGISGVLGKGHMLMSHNVMGGISLVALEAFEPLILEIRKEGQR